MPTLLGGRRDRGEVTAPAVAGLGTQEGDAAEIYLRRPELNQPRLAAARLVFSLLATTRALGARSCIRSYLPYPSSEDMHVTDFLDEKRKEITNRLKELQPAVDEYSRLQAAASALEGVGGSALAATTTTTAAPRRRGSGRARGSVNRASKAATAATPLKAARKKPGRPPGRATQVGGRKKVGRPSGSAPKAAPAGPSARRRAGRRKGTGTRAKQALSFVKGQPGITIPELAAKMGIQQNYLYRVLPGLERDGKVEKKGRGWHPKAASAT